MVSAEFDHASLYCLYLEALGLIPPALGPISRRQVCHARQRVGMVFAELGLESLHHLYLDLLCFVPPALVSVDHRQMG